LQSSTYQGLLLFSYLKNLNPHFLSDQICRIVSVDFDVTDQLLKV